MEPIRQARSGTIWRFIAVHFVLAAVINLVLFAGDTFRPLASATGGLLTGSLIANLAFIGVIVVRIILRYGDLRAYDVGLVLNRIPLGVLVTFGLWAAAQIIHALAGWLTYGEVQVASVWNSAGMYILIGMVLTQLFGNALFEEIAYRGFLFPQLYLRWRGLGAAWRLIAALLVSQGIFALAHIPNRIYLGMPQDAIAVDLLMLLGWGVLFTVIYARTDNLFVVIGIHALGNTPTTLFATAPFLEGAGGSLLMYSLVVFIFFGVPFLWRYRLEIFAISLLLLDGALKHARRLRQGMPDGETRQRRTRRSVSG